MAISHPPDPDAPGRVFTGFNLGRGPAALLAGEARLGAPWVGGIDAILKGLQCKEKSIPRGRIGPAA